MKKKSIATIGCGFVGGSLATVFAERNFTVYAFDKAGKYVPGTHPFISYQKSKEIMVSSEKESTYLDFRYPNSVAELVTHAEKDINFSNVFFVAVPTPMFEDGECDTSIVEGVLQEISLAPQGGSRYVNVSDSGVYGEESKPTRIAVIKSTVPPGSTERWNKMFNKHGLYVIHSPEFLREATALEDTRNQDRVILGGPKSHINKVRDIFRVAFPDVPIHKTSSSNSEFIKYVTNCFLAMKISFANEMYQICEKLKETEDVDYDRIIELATIDKRLGTSHWRVPSNELDENGVPYRGYGLVCFPKDVNALKHKAQTLGVKPTMLTATDEKNAEVRPQKDWAKMIGRSISRKK